MLEEIIQNRYAVTAVILFGIGFTNLMLQQNLLRKVIGFNIKMCIRDRRTGVLHALRRR